MSKHTPGPWMVDRTCGGLAIESAAHGNIGIVNLARASKADAALIAAAPDVLAALKDALRSARHDFDAGEKGEAEFRSAYSEQFAAIAKAEGKA